MDLDCYRLRSVRIGSFTHEDISRQILLPALAFNGVRLHSRILCQLARRDNWDCVRLHFLLLEAAATNHYFYLAQVVFYLHC